MNRIFLSIIIIVLLTACTPSESAVQTAIAQTQAANPTSTSTPQPTSTLTPTATPDVRVIKTDPKEFLLALDDLPSQGKYVLPNANWITPHHNSEVIQDRGAEAGKKYINETGRIDGWLVSYKRSVKNNPLPAEIFDNVVSYQTAEGAKLTVTKYLDDLFADGFTEISDHNTIGDITRVFIKKKDGYVWYDIFFTYKNYYHDVEGYGLETDVSPKVIEDIARDLLKKLIDAPLSSPY